MILAWMGDEWWCSKAQTKLILYFEVEFDLKDQNPLTQKKPTAKNNRHLKQGVVPTLDKI